ncbi:LOW QUALITY PROTEIN: hypothetical protein TorRG33x02_048970, partial [Trema orientale]
KLNLQFIKKSERKNGFFFFFEWRKNRNTYFYCTKRKRVNLLHYAKLCTYKKSKTSKTLQLKQNPLHKLLLVLLISNCHQKKNDNQTKVFINP